MAVDFSLAAVPLCAWFYDFPNVFRRTWSFYCRYIIPLFYSSPNSMFPAAKFSALNIVDAPQPSFKTLGNLNALVKITVFFSWKHCAHLTGQHLPGRRDLLLIKAVGCWQSALSNPLWWIGMSSQGDLKFEKIYPLPLVLAAQMQSTHQFDQAQPSRTLSGADLRLSLHIRFG